MSDRVKLIDLKDQRAFALAVWTENSNEYLVVPLNHWACMKLGRRAKNVALLISRETKFEKYFYDYRLIDPQVFQGLVETIKVDSVFATSLVDHLEALHIDLKECVALSLDFFLSARVFVPNTRQMKLSISARLCHFSQTFMLALNFFWGHKVIKVFYDSWFYKLYIKLTSAAHLFWGTICVRHWNRSPLGKLVTLGESAQVNWAQFEGLRKPYYWLHSHLWFAKKPFYWLSSKKWLLPHYFKILFSQRWRARLLLHKMRYWWGVKIIRPLYESRGMHFYYALKHTSRRTWALYICRYTGLAKIYYFVRYQWQKRVWRRGY